MREANWVSELARARTSRRTTVLGLTLVAALGCSDGGLKAGLGVDETGPARIILAPTSAYVSVDQTVTLRATVESASGLGVSGAVQWVSVGANLVELSNTEAVFSAGTPGVYAVVAYLASAPTVKDSVSIVVEAPVAATASIAVSPSSVSLSAGEALHFTAIATRVDGSTYVPAVSWSTDGGSIHSDGTFTAGTAVGGFSVIAAQVGSVLVDTSTVTVTPPPPPGANPHEPAGMKLGFENSFDTSPVGEPRTGWYVVSGAGNISIVNDATAPMSGPSVLQLKFPEGFGGGNGPMRMAWNESGHFPENSGTLYMRMQLKISANWTNNGNSGTKFFWPIPTNTSTNNFIPLNYGSNNFRAGYFLQAPFAQSPAQANLAESGSHANGAWHDVEWLLYQGSSAAAHDGRVQAWVDGVKVLDLTNKQFLNDGEPLGWKYLIVDPIFGFGTHPVPHDQYIWIDHWYASVK